MQSDYPSNKHGDVCIYSKSVLALRLLNIHYLQEVISFELKMGDKLSNFISLCRTPSQTQEKFEKFSENLEKNVERLFQNKTS